MAKEAGSRFGRYKGTLQESEKIHARQKAK
jgi:hypothetical protein